MLKLIHQEVLGGFMVLYFNPYLRKLETDILKSEYIDLIDPILIKEFKKAINSITPEYWQEIAFLLYILLMNKWYSQLLPLKWESNFYPKILNIVVN